MDALVFYVWSLLFLAYLTNADRVKRGFCSTRDLDIPNGSYRLRSGNSLVLYTCDISYTLYGPPQISCLHGSWSDDKPMCITNTCDKITPTANMTIVEEYNGAILKFSCSVNNKLSGSYRLICDGKSWNNNPPVCVSWIPPTECDFEDSLLCGWTHHDNSDVDWRWNTGGTRTRRTGPEYDHTLGQTGTGHYLYFESSSPVAPDHKAILISPKYLSEQSQQACFSFWYHILGTGDIGDFEVFFKPVSVPLTDVTSSFRVSVSMGEDWQFKSLDVTPSSEPFQIVFVATRATSYRSDFALDDVKLYPCPKSSPPTTQTSTKPPPPTTTTTTAAPPTTTTTTTPAPSTTTTTTTTTIMTTTTKPKPPSTTTSKPVTTEVITTTQAPKATQTQVTYSKTSRSVTATTTTKDSIPRSTLKPIVNPDNRVGGTSQALQDTSSSTSNVLYALLGVGLVLGVAAVVVAVFLIRRRKKRHVLASLHASNPVYTAVHEDQVHFATDDGYDRI